MPAPINGGVAGWTPLSGVSLRPSGRTPPVSRKNCQTSSDHLLSLVSRRIANAPNGFASCSGYRPSRGRNACFWQPANCRTVWRWKSQHQAAPASMVRAKRPAPNEAVADGPAGDLWTALPIKDAPPLLRSIASPGPSTTRHPDNQPGSAGSAWPVRKVRYEWIGDCPIFNYRRRELELMLGASGFERVEIFAPGRSGFLVRAAR